MAAVKAGREHSCVGWQVTLRDLMWQMTPRSSEMDSHKRAIRTFNILTFIIKTEICWLNKRRRQQQGTTQSSTITVAYSYIRVMFVQRATMFSITYTQYVYAIVQ